MFDPRLAATALIVATLSLVSCAQAEDDDRVKVLLLRLPEAGITPAAASRSPSTNPSSTASMTSVSVSI